MKPIYFPYTYISRPMLDRLNFFFKRITVYQPCAPAIPDDLKALEDEGLLDIQLPVQGAEKKIAAVLRDYNSWAGMHQGRGMAFFKTQGNYPPFFTETSTAQIKKDIRKNAGPSSIGNPVLNDSEMLFNARVFLLIAQQMDYQNSQSTTCLETTDIMESNLFKQLKGEEDTFALDSVPGDFTPKDNLRDYMISERLYAFGRLVRQDEKTSGIYVTDSRPVMEYLLEKLPHMQMLSNVDEILSGKNAKEDHTPRREKFEQYLEMLVTTSASVSCGQAVGSAQGKAAGTPADLTLYLVEDRSPQAFFSECTARTPTDSVSGSDNNHSLKNTLICFIEY
ncbi:MAG: hypothetical protein JRE58_10980 [Deltaproteobacteria bacterium]|nr:hypothetical protein [Deltaproteobacteria bacterium]